MQELRLDLNSPVFQQTLFGLQKEEQTQALKTLKKLHQLSWESLYRDAGLKWELIHSRQGLQGQKLYSLRITRKMRAVAYRDGDWLRLLSLHPDHDSAY